MDIPGSTTDYQSALSAQLQPVFSDNVRDLLGVGTLPKSPTAIITVNSIADVVNDSDGVTTLREAINRANADNGEDLIVFERSLFSTAQTITLNLGELDITHNLDIIAPRDSLTGENLVTISGNKASRVFEVETDATVTLSGLIVVDGSVTDDNGGGIKNSGTLTLDSSIVSNNTTNTNSPLYVGGKGGGIYSSTNLTVTNSTISGNSALSGGGIENAGILKISNSTISGNSASVSGGGIYNSFALELNNSSISGNSAGVSGGGLYDNNASFALRNSTIGGNSAGVSGNNIFNLLPDDAPIGVVFQL